MNVSTEPSGPIGRWVIGVGGAALLGCMLIGTVGVIARHLGVTIVGDIELEQSAIVVSAAAALVCATHARRHARVHLLLNRLTPVYRMWLTYLSAILSSVFFALLTVGLGVITLDLRNSHEESELLHIPYAPLRLIALAATVTSAALCAARVRSRVRQ